MAGGKERPTGSYKVTFMLAQVVKGCAILY